jgi:hypothetical protein
MSVVANTVKFIGILWLARIYNTYVNRILTVNLWDPGEGANDVQILNNSGTAMPFSWTVNPCTGLGSCGSGAGTVTSLPVNGSNQPQPAGNRYGDGKYNDRMLTLTVTIPGSYSATANNGWWQLVYNIQGGSTKINDRTTWQASVSGSPIHLLNQ